MDPSTLVPYADVIPVAWGWFEFLLLFTFILHILFMNALVGTGVITLVNLFRRGPDESVKLGSRMLPILLAFTINAGIAPLLFVQVLYGNMFYASSSIMAVTWLSLIAVLIVAYYMLYDFKFRFFTTHRKWVLLVSMVLILWTGFVLVNNLTQTQNILQWTKYFQDKSGWVMNLGEYQVYPRYLHFMVGAVAVGGLFLALIWQWRARRGDPEAAARMEESMKWFTGATFLQVIVGPWFLSSLRPEVLLDFLGGSALHTLVFFLGLAGVVAALYFGCRRMPRAAALAIGWTAVFMVSIRELVRVGYMKGVHSPAQMPVQPQYGPMIVFLVTLVLGLAIVAWMLSLYIRHNREA
jgi:hypothetical protein